MLFGMIPQLLGVAWLWYSGLALINNVRRARSMNVPLVVCRHRIHIDTRLRSWKTVLPQTLNQHGFRDSTLFTYKDDVSKVRYWHDMYGSKHKGGLHGY